MSTTLWLSFSNSLDVQARTEATDERIHEVRLTMDRIGRELSMAFISPSRNSTASYHAEFRAEAGGDQDRIDFASFSHLPLRYSARESDQAEISYFVEQTPTGPALVRRSDPQLDDEPDSGGTRFVLLQGIEKFNLRYFDGRANSWREDWDSEEGETAERMPVQIEVSILARAVSEGETDRAPIFLRTVIVVPLIEIVQ